MEPSGRVVSRTGLRRSVSLSNQRPTLHMCYVVQAQEWMHLPGSKGLPLGLWFDRAYAKSCMFACLAISHYNSSVVNH